MTNPNLFPSLPVLILSISASLSCAAAKPDTLMFSSLVSSTSTSTSFTKHHRQLVVSDECNDKYVALHNSNADLDAANAKYIVALDSAVDITNFDSCEEKDGGNTIACNYDTVVDGEVEYVTACEAIGDGVSVTEYSVDITCTMTDVNGDPLKVTMNFPEISECMPDECIDANDITDLQKFLTANWEINLISAGFSDVDCVGGEILTTSSSTNLSTTRNMITASVLGGGILYTAMTML